MYKSLRQHNVQPPPLSVEVGIPNFKNEGLIGSQFLEGMEGGRGWGWGVEDSLQI